MAKLGKLTKLKSAIKRWPSLTKLSRNNSSVSSSTKQHEHEQELHAVYVGKSRRQYLVNSDVIQHPVFQELVDRSSCDDGVVSVEGETQLGSMAELVEFYNCGAC
ncbi:putative small auxin-up RNA [Medicago truncatula]|uniref:Putative small auxin-up RNA n=1 Tax=Medicago truncatula TaxID=3880 RepID=A0A396GH85_MEDTR|nr:putative small auxin-up RNA [Medicago truncatula]